MTSREYPRRRILFCLAAFAAAGLLPAGTDTPTPAPQATAFSIPRPDLGGLPSQTRMEVAAARTLARNAPDDAEKVGALGVQYYKHDFAEAATECFARAGELAPAELRWAYYLGMAHAKGGDVAAARAAYERAIGLDRAYGPTYVQLADLLVERDVAEAVKLYQSARELNADDARAHFGLGRCAEIQGRLDDALAHFERAVEIAPDYGQAHEAMATILAAQGRAAEAATHRQRQSEGGTPSLEHDPLLAGLVTDRGTVNELVQKAVSLAQQRRFEEGIALLEQAAERNPADVSARLSLGVIYAMQGRYAEAAEQFRMVLERDPQNLRAKAHLAQALADMGQLDDGESLLREVLSAEPDDADTLLRLGILQAKRGNAAEAERHLLRSAELRPGGATVHFQLGKITLALGKYAEAVEHLQRGIEQNAGDPLAHYLLGAAFQRQGNVESARSAWQEAIRVGPRFTNAYVALAVLESGNQQVAEGIRLCKQGLEQTPKSPLLANTLAWILATCPDETHRDGPAAVRWAEQACELTKNANAVLLDTLAAAYAEAGRFEDAVKAQRQTIKLTTQAGASEQLEAYRARLALYEAGQPYREGE
ncbi:MAG: tetratricopeptide repeat protein [Planctomycetota bacterium]|jgi:tetratricopeptide (TPR) repeat protein